jgi:sulfonate transport system ATP-binding protein
VLLVTHDVDEAVLLADRVTVLKAGEKSLDRRIDLPRPRSRIDPGFGEFRRLLLAEIGVFTESRSGSSHEGELAAELTVGS